MIKALLFDLDDTLLGNDMGTFIPAYFQSVAGHFADVNGAALLNGLMAGTQAMLANTNPTLTLRQVFIQHFPLAHNGQEAGIWERFDEFYRTSFESLHALTTPRVEARPVLEWAASVGYRLIVATNALFPEVAIRARLRWAGLEAVPFEFVTHIENSHFAKPQPEYFAEILARAGLRPAEALMVGNDWNDDIVPAAKLGLATWWIAEPGREPLNGAEPVGIGSLRGFLRWAQTRLAGFEPPAQPPSRIPFRLAGNLAFLAGELSQLTAAQWKERPDAHDWSLTEAICHLRDVDAEVNLPRLNLLLNNDNPFISGAITDPWAIERNYQAQDGAEALRVWAGFRQQLIAELRTQPPTVWQRTARHALFGPSTLAEIMGWALDHDRLHLEQVRNLLRQVNL